MTEVTNGRLGGSMGVETSIRLANAFIDTFNRGAIDPGIYADGATLWNNITGVDQPHGSGDGVGRQLKAALPDLRFDDAVVHGWDGGFAVEYIVKATLPDGSELRAPACGVGAVVGDRIGRFLEYVDSRQVAPLSEILVRAMEQAE